MITIAKVIKGKKKNPPKNKIPKNIIMQTRYNIHVNHHDRPFIAPAVQSKIFDIPIKLL